MARILIIAYGNPLRSDDGLAWHAADLLQAKLLQEELPSLDILRLQQLGPELAETLRHHDAVIFLDAAAPAADLLPGHTSIQELGSDTSSSRASHACAPTEIIKLARELYDVQLRAYLATMVGENFDPGETLSTVITAALPAFVRRVAAFIDTVSSGAPV